jgi:sialate O-acetylesterase
LATIYGKPIIAQGPTPNGLCLVGGKLVVDFDTGGTTISIKGGSWNDVEIAAADGIYQPAQATVTGNTATLTSAAVREPRAIRYGWRPFFTPTLFNADGLPTAPFALWMDHVGNIRSGVLTTPSPKETKSPSKP